MSWRYQPVIRISEESGENFYYYFLIEVVLDENDGLTGWSNYPSKPVGENLEELIDDLANMWISAMCWKPVLLTDLKMGMTFEKSVSHEVQSELADFIERGGSLLKQQRL